MSWRHTLTIVRATGTVDQDPDTGAISSVPEATTIYEGKGTLLHDKRAETRAEDRDPALVSTGVLYLKSRKLVRLIQQGDVVFATDLKLKFDLTAIVESMDHVVGMLKVSDIRPVSTVETGWGNNYGNDYGGALA